MNRLFWLMAQINQNDINVPKGDLDNSDFQSAFRIIFGFAGGIAVLLVAYGGVRYVLSQGNPQETAKAKDIILNSLIGMALIITSFGIVGYLTGVL